MLKSLTVFPLRPKTSSANLFSKITCRLTFIHAFLDRLFLEKTRGFATALASSACCECRMFWPWTFWARRFGQDVLGTTFCAGRFGHDVLTSDVLASPSCKIFDVLYKHATIEHRHQHMVVLCNLTLCSGERYCCKILTFGGLKKGNRLTNLHHALLGFNKLERLYL